MRFGVRRAVEAASIGAAALLSACSGWLQSEPSIAGPSAPLAAAIDRATGSVIDRAASWLAPGAKTANELLYVSDLGTFDVNVYSFPSLSMVGKLTGFNEPQGECAGSGGDFWVTSTGNEQIWEFAHGGTSAIAKLSDPVGYPVGCAIDPTNGNLAVTNLYDFSGSGGVLIYEHGGGTPRSHSNSSQYYYYFDGYDPHGNLYVSGMTLKKQYQLFVLPHDSDSMSQVTIKGATLYLAGTVAWAASHLVLGDQRCKNRASSCLYELTVSGKTASVTGTTPLNEACDVAQVWIGSDQIAGGDYEYCRKRASSADLWPYPAGGNPSARVKGLREPVGAVVSIGSSASQR
jgi:hypothetical protein